MKGKKGRPHIETSEEAMSAIPFRLRGTQRSFGKQAGVSRSTIAHWVQRGLLRSHSNAIKSFLTPQHNVRRLDFVLSQVNPVHNIEDQSIRFNELDHVVRIDEKCFNIRKASKRFYLTSTESKPYRSCQSKRYITKAMLMCAVATPQFGPDGEVIFDGRICILPFTYEEAAARNSMNRVAGTMVTKPIESINKNVIRNCLIKQVAPTIKAKWPLGCSSNIVIQQDNARPHISPADSEFMAAGNSDGFNITLKCKPANSPDLNVLDLGFFRAIQSLQTEMVSKTVEELV